LRGRQRAALSSFSKRFYPLNEIKINQGKKVKHRIKSFGRLLLMCSAVALAAFVPQKAKAQVTNTAYLSLTNLPTYIVGGGTSNINSQAFEIPKGQGFSFFSFFGGTNIEMTENIQFRFAPTYDGTNYATTNFLVMTTSGNGFTGQRGWTNFTPFQANNGCKWKLAQIFYAGNATNKVFLTNGIVAFSN